VFNRAQQCLSLHHRTQTMTFINIWPFTPAPSIKCIFCSFILKYSYFNLSCESEFEGSISQVKFFRPYDDDLVQPSELLTELAFDPAPINLLAVSTLSPSVVFEVFLGLGVSICLDMVSIETLDLDTFKSWSRPSRKSRQRKSRQFEKWCLDTSRSLDLDLDWSRQSRPPSLGIW
jgi:hypothetical protein